MSNNIEELQKEIAILKESNADLKKRRRRLMLSASAYKQVLDEIYDIAEREDNSGRGGLGRMSIILNKARKVKEKKAPKQLLNLISSYKSQIQDIPKLKKQGVKNLIYGFLLGSSIMLFSAYMVLSNIGM